MTTNSIVDILQRLGTLDWYSIRPSSLVDGELPNEALPIITFRFEGGNGDAYSCLSELLSRWEYASTWVLVGVGEKNLTLASALVLGERETPSLAKARELAKQDAEIVRRVGKEYLELLDYLNTELPA